MGRNSSYSSTRARAFQRIRMVVMIIITIKFVILVYYFRAYSDHLIGYHFSSFVNKNRPETSVIHLTISVVYIYIPRIIIKALIIVNQT